MKRSVVVLACGLLVAGCSYTAGLFKPRPMTTTLQLESEPAGAEAKPSLGGGSCRTPCALPVTGAADFTVTFTLAGYLPQTVPVQFIPPVDPRTDPSPRLDPNPAYAALAPAPPPKHAPVKKKRPVAKRQPAAPAADAAPSSGAGSAAASPFPPPPASPFPPPR